MTHARPFWTSTLQDLSIDINNTPMWGVLTLAIKLWVFGSPRRLQAPTFGSVSFIFTLSPKWGYDTWCQVCMIYKWISPFIFTFFPCSTFILKVPKFSSTLFVYAPILQPPSSFIEYSIIYKTKQQGLTEHNLLDLTFRTKQQKQNITKLEGDEKRNLHLLCSFPF